MDDGSGPQVPDEVLYSFGTLTNTALAIRVRPP